MTISGDDRMKFTFETTYHHEAITAMAKAIRKTVRKKENRRIRLVAVMVIVLVLLLTLPFGGREFVLSVRTVMLFLCAALMLCILLFEDKVKAYASRKRMLPGSDQATAVFTAEGYRSETAAGSSDFQYSMIVELAETADYFIFVLSQWHAQVYDKKSITGGTMEEFRAFIKEVTGKEIHTV